MIDHFLSQYIFLNLFTGVVVESFSYVFQSTGGVLKSITRHETRAFKKAWALFSNPETRLLERKDLARFLAVRAISESLFDRPTHRGVRRNSTASLKCAPIQPSTPENPSYRPVKTSRKRTMQRAGSACASWTGSSHRSTLRRSGSDARCMRGSITRPI